jgi:hypothetical protein
VKNCLRELRVLPIAWGQTSTLDGNFTNAFIANFATAFVKEQDCNAFSGVAGRGKIACTGCLLVEKAFQNYAGLATAHSEVQDAVVCEVLLESLYI